MAMERGRDSAVDHPKFSLGGEQSPMHGV